MRAALPGPHSRQMPARLVGIAAGPFWALFTKHHPRTTGTSQMLIPSYLAKHLLLLVCARAGGKRWGRGREAGRRGRERETKVRRECDD